MLLNSLVKQGFVLVFQFFELLLEHELYLLQLVVELSVRPLTHFNQIILIMSVKSKETSVYGLIIQQGRDTREH